MEKAGQARQEGVGLIEQRFKKANVKRMPSPRTLAFNKPYGMRPCFTDDQGLPTLTQCVTIPEVYEAG